MEISTYQNVIIPTQANIDPPSQAHTLDAHMNLQPSKLKVCITIYYLQYA